MKTKYKLDKAFGPVGSPTGFLVLAAGVYACWYSVAGLILVLPGALFAFSYTCCFVDYGRSRIKFSTVVMGIIQTGKWMAVDHSMRLEVKETGTTWRTYSRSNRAMDSEVNDFRIVLLASDDSQLTEVAKFNDAGSANAQLETMARQLGLASG